MGRKLHSLLQPFFSHRHPWVLPRPFSSVYDFAFSVLGKLLFSLLQSSGEDQRGGQKEFSSFRASYEDMVGAFIDSLAPTGSLTNVPPVRKIGFGARLLRRRIWSLCSLQVKGPRLIGFPEFEFDRSCPFCVLGGSSSLPTIDPDLFSFWSSNGGPPKTGASKHVDEDLRTEGSISRGDDFPSPEEE
ncbi:hypothetical protein VNO78_23660 [Psophocarpus tetragonolobus]|uniref:Uncharacterized protein n=1 Tax=Psophocarpus tetragonolobus TaxID=3891 RepID=A0AAN9S747_PSOTE